jgi:LysM repeat protein
MSIPLENTTARRGCLAVSFLSAEVGDFISRRETMNTKRFLSIVVIVLLAALMLAACSRSASKAPASQATATKGNFPSLGKTPQVNQQDAIKTQTAIAKQNQNPILDQPTETAAPQPVAPQPEATQAPAVAQATAVPAQAVSIPTVTPGMPTTYKLQKGEFVYCIARRFNVDPAAMLSLNGLSQSSYVYEGMTLKIPQTGGNFPDGRALKKHPATYTVASGDTIYSVACKYGDVEPWAIAMANNLAAPYTLTSGSVINIP